MECSVCSRNMSKVSNHIGMEHKVSLEQRIQTKKGDFFEIYPEFTGKIFDKYGIRNYNVCVICVLKAIGITELKGTYMYKDSEYCSSCGRSMIRKGVVYSANTMSIQKDAPGFLDVYPEFKGISGYKDPNFGELVMIHICHVCLLKGLGVDIVEMQVDPMVINITP